jgi:transposase
MDKIEYREVMKFFVREGLTPKEIRSKFIKIYGGSSPSFSTIKKWGAEFTRTRCLQRKDKRAKPTNLPKKHWFWNSGNIL